MRTLRAEGWENRGLTTPRALGLALSGVLLATIVYALFIHDVTPTRDAAFPSQVGSTTATESAPVEDDVETSYASIGVIGDGYLNGSGSFATLLGDALQSEVVKAGCAGAGYARPGLSCGTFGDVLVPLVDAGPDAIFIAGGQNDVYSAEVGVDAARGLLQTITEELPDADVFVVNPWWFTTAPPAGLSTLSDGLAAVADEFGVTFLDTGQPVAEGLADATTALPTPDGHTALATAIVEAWQNR